jgi:hypothetical protein
MVASAIGQRFGSGDEKAGKSFLEKIIQVPLNIPKAQPDSLKKFCLSRIDNVLRINEISLTEEEVRRFVYQFTTNVLPRLTTPRLAIRYVNTLSFTIPLLKGEVNMVDLMLIEALKMFYPEHYNFVKNNSTYFIDLYINEFDTSSKNQKKDEIDKHLENLGKNLSKSDKENVKALLSNLFPILDSVFKNYILRKDRSNEWYRNKLIASANYFDRYFSYTVIEGDMSDIEFEHLIKYVDDEESVDNITQKIRSILSKTSPDNFILKIRSREKELTWKLSKKLIKALCNISELLPSEGGLLDFRFETPFGQAAIFIYEIFKRHKENKETELFDFAKELMTFPSQLSFAYEINKWLWSGDRIEDKLFTEIEYQELAEILTKRAIKEAGEDTIFEKFYKYICDLVYFWAISDKNSLDECVKSYLDKDPKNVITLIKAYVPTIKSSTKPEPFKGDLNKDRYDYIISFFDKNMLFEKIKEAIPIEELEKEKPDWETHINGEFTEINMLRQFVHWYNDKEKDGR